MKRQSLLALAGWFAAAVIAVAVGVTAVTLLGTGITSDPVEPMSQESAQRELDARATAPGRSSPPSAQPPSPSESAPPDGAQTNPDAADGGARKILQSKAGSVAAFCAGGDAVLDWWTPAQGYTVDDYEAGPDQEVSVEFEHGDADVEMKIACLRGEPRLLNPSPED